MADRDTVAPSGHDVVEVIALLANPATSYWLKDAIVSAFERDPFDAERDALVLAELLTRRLDALVMRHFAPPGGQRSP